MAKKKRKRNVPARASGAAPSPGPAEILQWEAQAYSGPIPSPGDLESYEKLQPGLADRLVAMAERQMAHRQATETKVINANVFQAKTGVVFAFLLALAFLGAAVWLAVNGHEWVASIIGGTTMVSIVTAFIFGKREQRLERTDKFQLLQAGGRR